MGRGNNEVFRGKGKLAKFDALIRRMASSVAWLCGSVVVLLALMICVDVFLRFVFNAPLPASVEATVLLLPWIAFPPFFCALITGTHVRVTLVTDQLPPRVQLAFLIFSNIVGLALFSGVTYWGWLHFWESFIVKEVMLAAVQLPWWVAKLAFPVGMFLMAVVFLNMLVLQRSALLSRKKEE